MELREEKPYCKICESIYCHCGALACNKCCCYDCTCTPLSEDSSPTIIGKKRKSSSAGYRLRKSMRITTELKTRRNMAKTAGILVEAALSNEEVELDTGELYKSLAEARVLHDDNAENGKHLLKHALAMLQNLF